MVKVWQCPRCGLTVDDDEWRRAIPDRTICQNRHPPTKMRLLVSTDENQVG